MGAAIQEASVEIRAGLLVWRSGLGNKMERYQTFSGYRDVEGKI
jgi:hypothetical protein